jgi:hypothetical protein
MPYGGLEPTIQSRLPSERRQFMPYTAQRPSMGLKIPSSKKDMLSYFLVLSTTFLDHITNIASHVYLTLDGDLDIGFTDHFKHTAHDYI